MMMHAAHRYLRPDLSKAPPTSLLLCVSLILKHGPRVGVYFMRAPEPRLWKVLLFPRVCPLDVINKIVDETIESLVTRLESVVVDLVRLNFSASRGPSRGKKRGTEKWGHGYNRDTIAFDKTRHPKADSIKRTFV